VCCFETLLRSSVSSGNVGLMVAKLLIEVFERKIPKQICLFI
jgi:hypothetical protein